MRNPLARPESLAHVLFLRQAASALEDRLREQPDNLVLRERLGQTYRGLGEIDKAGRLFTDLVESDRASARVRELSKILTGHIPDEPMPGGAAWPAPFYKMDEFLAPGVIESLMAEVDTRHDDFADIPVYEAKHGDNVLDSSVRKGTSLLFDALNDLAKAKVVALVPTLTRHLRLPDFAIREVELKVTRHADGGYFKVHRDDTVSARRISFGCYFHFGERRFEGGDLLLFDTDYARFEPVSYDYTRLCYRFNTAIFFRSDCYHAATEVKLLAHGPRAGRYAIIGHVRAESD